MSNSHGGASYDMAVVVVSWSCFVAVVDMFLRTQNLVQGGESSQGLKNINLSQLGWWLG